VLVGGAPMPARGALPEVLGELSELQGMTLSDDAWSADLALLLERVRLLLALDRTIEPLDDLHREVLAAEQRYWTLLDANRRADALEAAQRQLATLDRISPLYPDDILLQIERGYAHKNCSIVLGELGRGREADAALERSDAVFTTLLEEYPENPSAWDGKGSIVWMRGQPREALPYFERALELDPGYEAARRNRDAILGAS
jgi:tetratricopeptide (TPR) repeat protein